MAKKDEQKGDNLVSKNIRYRPDQLAAIERIKEDDPEEDRSSITRRAVDEYLARLAKEGKRKK